MKILVVSTPAVRTAVVVKVAIQEIAAKLVVKMVVVVKIAILESAVAVVVAMDVVVTLLTAAPNNKQFNLYIPVYKILL